MNAEERQAALEKLAQMTPVPAKSVTDSKPQANLKTTIPQASHAAKTGPKNVYDVTGAIRQVQTNWVH